VAEPRERLGAEGEAGHGLKTFINADNYAEKTLLWQTLIHVAFLVSAMAIAATDRILSGPAKH
jgi:uncharacterized protein (TIGR00645 family)